MINTNTQSILLLTSYFSKSAGDAKPLSPTEWGRFALWLNEQGKTPADLVTAEPCAVLQGWQDDKISLERIEQLLGRGHALALALEKWSRAGIWVLTRSDADYPKLFKQRLRNSAPPVLFGCGNARLLNQHGVCVVGARKANEADLGFATALGERIAEAGFSVVSGGARGVDEAAMLGGLKQDGTVIGIMADSLLSAAMASKWRKGLMDNNLVLVSPFYPEAGFNAGNAMARNKYIYCLSQAAVVVRSDTKGGTWSGAIENLKKAWVPLWVKRVQDVQSGNQALISEGGYWLGEAIEHLDIQSLCAPATSNLAAADLLSTDSGVAVVTNTEQAGPDVAEGEPSQASSSVSGPVDQAAQTSPEPNAVAIEMSFYQFFLSKMAHLQAAVTADELAERWDVPKKQINDWLKQSVDEGRVRKLSKPVRYQLMKDSGLENVAAEKTGSESVGQLRLGLD
ncbi:DNA-protecting protein DprA [Pseudomonas aeruginosa]|uniref:DNA-processing protein DprA n=1 Tax=Pseudomonas aeruginosa TaxID=287 RepID=UPI0004118998|nr:DNA-processing protein DprA [Pseudomonas aeruginosa]EKX5732664.1 DNA-protecting protein DprA [Pseudomonas aeruginosa]EMC2534453.1 DNA-protecting protein DprA [Pseudomonas aeruginosa]MBG6559701.1 DNA-protecting protein DprA [Pseudomonas aeruginosa]MBH3842211.1 DNA-protecting protein DprA [Pseudomonas aeruginosa]MBH4532373.1 DNA-protecting protein DprA [Pseudomonas aeruginosa]